MNEDLQHLRWLTLGHYVVAGVTALFACLPLIHVGIGLFLLFDPPSPGPGQPPAPFPLPLVGLLFVVLGAVFVLSGWACAGCMFVAGRSLAARKRYTFCIIVAAISCTFFPLGTALGVFTILVLSRPSVKALFENPRPPKPLPIDVP